MAEKSHHVGSVVVVTGGASGIGRAIVDRLLEAGHGVVAVDRSERVADPVTSSPIDRLLSISVDVTDSAAVQLLVQAALQRFGRIDGLVNNAAVSLGEGFLETRKETWDRTLAVNLTAPMMCSQAIAREMISSGTRGRIVNVASVNAFSAERGTASYVASKGGLVALTRAMAVDLAPFGITVNAIAPGPIRTDATRELFETEPVQGAIRRGVPLGRPGSPEEVADLVLYLMTTSASYINGTSITIDGGFSAYVRLD